MTSREPLLQRNVPRAEAAPQETQEPEHFGFDDPSTRFDVPEGYEKPTPWNVARYWQEQLEAAGRWNEGWPSGGAGVRRGLRDAKALLGKYEYVDILRAIRWWSGPGGLKPGRSFRLEWLLRQTDGRTNLDTFFMRVYERGRRG